MRIHRICPQTRAEGPGNRFCIWVQGCSVRCDGCFNQQMWDPDGGMERSVEELLAQIAATPDIEGVTFLGGEPFDQSGELSELLAGIRKLGLSTLVFTGHPYPALQARSEPEIGRCLAQIDLLIDGPFRKEQVSRRRPWVGSDNQEFLFLTDRYGPGDIAAAHDRVEIRFNPDGSIDLNGIADHPMLEKLQQALSSRKERSI